MKRLCLNLLFFFLLFTLLLFFVGKFDNIDKLSSDNHNIQKIQLESKFDSLDILFIGNSYCYSGINPAYFDSVGIKSYNLGIATAGPKFYPLLVADYLTTVKQAPKSIFILISPMIFSSKADDIINYPIHRYLNQPVSNEEYIFFNDLNSVKNYPKILIKSFTKSLVNLFSVLKKAKPEGNTAMAASKGFVASADKYSLKNELKNKHLYASLPNDRLDSEKTKELLDLASGLEQKKIKVVFYELPSNKLYAYFSLNYITDYNNFKNQLKGKYLVISDNEKLDETYFRDMDHLNTAGAAVSSKYIIEQIKLNPGLLKQ